MSSLTAAGHRNKFTTMDGKQKEPEGLDDTTTCPVCENKFSLDEHIPRLFPCTHTTCEKCLNELVGGETVTCPQCNKKHRPKKGVESFRKNRYIIKYLEADKAPRESSNEFDVFEMCPKHGRKLNIYCRSKDCEQDICQVCLIEQHNGHELVDYIQEDKKADSLQAYLKHCEHSLTVAKEEVETKCKQSIAVLKKNKLEHKKIMDTRIKEISKNMKKERGKLEKQLTKVREQFVEYEKFREETKSESENSSIQSRVKAIGKIEQKTLEAFKDKTSYRYYKTVECDGEQTKQAWDSSTEERLSVSLPWKPITTEFAVNSE